MHHPIRKNLEKFIAPFTVPHNRKIRLKNDFTPDYKPEGLDKESSRDILQEGVQMLSELQDKLYAQNTTAVLVVFQAMDAAGKDGTIKHVMSGINPQGCQVFSFKGPSHEELDHDYLWRCAKRLPERGRIGIFNRSYYEEVLVARVHPEILARQQLPPEALKGPIWKTRFEQINNFERYLSDNGTAIVKFFLNVSRDEQKKRFLERIERPEKNWKFSASDVRERQFWKDYMNAYEDVFNNTSTKWAPWYVVPADAKWFTRIAVAAVLIHRLNQLGLAYPKVTKEQRESLLEAKELLEKEA
jgi:PPK2 family polyphosphate:nucleotide phosphotransferase